MFMHPAPYTALWEGERGCTWPGGCEWMEGVHKRWRVLCYVTVILGTNLASSAFTVGIWRSEA